VALTRAEERLTLTTIAEKRARYRCSLKIFDGRGHQEARRDTDAPRVSVAGGQEQGGFKRIGDATVPCQRTGEIFSK